MSSFNFERAPLVVRKINNINYKIFNVNSFIEDSSLKDFGH
jgi:hypothetical protein